MNDTIKLLNAIRKGYVNPTKTDEKVFVNVIKAIFRSVSDYKKVLYVSKKALEKAKSLNINLAEINWHTQSKVDKGRKIFHYEHCNPIKQLRLAVLYSNEKIEKILDKDITCWILKSENDILNKKYKDNRPGGWKKCYKECGIEILKNTKKLYADYIKEENYAKIKKVVKK